MGERVVRDAVQGIRQVWLMFTNLILNTVYYPPTLRSNPLTARSQL